MSEPRAIIDQLTRGLTQIGVAGGLVLTAVLVIDMVQWSERRHLLVPGWSDVRNLKLGILLCFIVTIGAIVVAARRVVKRSLAPLHDSVGQIEEAIAAPRGFRLDLANLPVEMAGQGAAINRLIDQLERVAIRREAFAAEVAHELKNPMAVLLLELDSIGSEQAWRLKGDVRRMNRLIDQLLLMAKLEAHATAPVQATLINLADLAAELVQKMVPDAIDQGRHITLKIDHHSLVHGRLELLSAAMRNMVENALRVTPPHGVVMVTVGPGARISVTDGGRGLSRQELARLRKPFAQAHCPSECGAGLGLAIIDEVARLHGGLLDCDPDRKQVMLTLAPAGTDRAPQNQYVDAD